MFQLPEPGLDEGLVLGVAVAAAPVCDAELGELGFEAAAGEGRAVVGAEGERASGDGVLADGLIDERDRFVGATAQLERPADDLAGWLSGPSSKPRRTTKLSEASVYRDRGPGHSN